MQQKHKIIAYFINSERSPYGETATFEKAVNDELEKGYMPSGLPIFASCGDGVIVTQLLYWHEGYPEEETE